MALAAQQEKRDHRVVALLSDGECDEGSNWEAILFAAHHRLKNLLAIIDYNKIQSLDTVDNTVRLEPFAAKWTAFGWEVRQCDGHDHAALERALGPATGTQPVVVLADTVKGKGVSFMEHQVLWHYRTARGDEFAAAQAELESSP
jgi:transketolase